MYSSAVMGQAFTKLFASITDSTIWREPDNVRIVWITMLASADARGRVFASVPGLADKSRVSLEACVEALDRLLSPDPWSRTSDNEGRRIEAIDGGWRLINYTKYRELRDEEAIKASKREWWHKNKGKLEKPLEKLDRTRSNSTQEEAEAEADKNNTSRFALFWSSWPNGPRKTAKKQCLAKWISQGCEADADRVMAALEWFKASEQWVKDGGAFVPMPMTWLNRRSWEIEIPKGKPQSTYEESRALIEAMERDRKASQSPESIEARKRALSALKRVA